MIPNKIFPLIYEPSQNRNQNSLITESEMRQSEPNNLRLFSLAHYSVQTSYSLLKNFVRNNNCTGSLDATG